MFCSWIESAEMSHTYCAHSLFHVSFITGAFKFSKMHEKVELDANPIRRRNELSELVLQITQGA